MSKRLFVLATALGTASCASLPDYTPQAGLPDMPERYATAHTDAGTAAAIDWVTELGDAQLQALILEAADNNPSLAVSLARFESARAAARASGANRLPSLNGGLDYTRREADAGGSDSFGLGLSASWEADLWGRVADGTRASATDALAAEEDLRASQLSIAGLVAKSWFNLIEARQQTELAVRNVETNQNSLNLTERRFARGLVRSSDVRTARSAVASAEAALASRERVEAAAARSLETLLGRYPAGQIAHDADLPELVAIVSVGSPESLLSRRPDVRAAERRLEAAGLRADAAAKALYPSLSITGSTGTGGADVSDLTDLDSLVSTLAGSLTAPIFQGGRLRAQRDQARASAEAEVANYVSTVLNAWQEAEDALHGDEILEQRVERLGQAYEEAAAAEALVIRQYTSGVATIFNLLDAQSRRISAESQFISAQRERATNRVDLYLAIAGELPAAVQNAQPTAQTGE